jgi:hypothetical protein
VSVPAQIQTAGRQLRNVTLFLGDRAANHAGHERPSEMLNSGIRFLPALERDAIEFMCVDTLLVVTMDADLEFGNEEARALEHAYGTEGHRRVVVDLDDGTAVRGDLTYMLPQGQRRIQDHLNNDEPFFTVRDGNRVRLINKRHVVLVVPE